MKNQLERSNLNCSDIDELDKLEIDVKNQKS